METHQNANGWDSAPGEAALFPSDRLFDFPVSTAPSVKSSLREALVSFVLTPAALIALLISSNSLLAWAAFGQPLSSPEAAMGLAVAALLLARVGKSATQTMSGIFVAAMWSLVAVLPYSLGLAQAYNQIRSGGLGSVAVRSSVAQLVLPSAWSGFPFLILAVTLGALAAAGIARHKRVHPSSARVRAHQSRAAGILALLAIMVIWLTALELAPAEISEIAVYGVPALGLTEVSPLGILLLAIGLFALATSAGWGALTTAALTALLLAFPALLLFPVSSSLGGAVAAPGEPLATSLALAAPVVGSVAIVLISLVWALHWVQSPPTPAAQDPV